MKIYLFVPLAVISFMISGCAISQGQQQDIKVNTGIGLQYNDIECKNLIKPYSYTKNLMEFSTFVAKTKVESLFNRNLTDKEQSNLYKNGFKQLDWMPISMEIDLGNRMHFQRKDILQNKGRNKRYYKKANLILKNIVKNIGKKNPYDFEVYLIRGNHKDIFSYPGGKIYLTKNMLKDLKYAKISIAHEVAHSLKRHYVMEYETIFLDLLDSDNFIKTVKDSINYKNEKSSEFDKIFNKIAIAYTAKNTFFNITKDFNKNQELAADSCAVRLLKNDDQLYAIINSFYKNLSTMSIEKKNKKGLDAFLDFNINAHPTNKKRLANIKAIMKLIKNQKRKASKK